MSNALAIASVTETLAQTLGAALSGSGVNGASVTKTRPDATDLPKVGVNVFLYQVSPNAAWRNADLPTRSSAGALLRRPQAALDLFYLLTFYGDDTALEQQRLLGAVVRRHWRLRSPAAPAAWADRIALLPSRGGADPAARTTLDGELAKAERLAQEV